MRVREIKKKMLEKYSLAIKEYYRDRIRLENQQNKIRQFERELHDYFDINISHNFT